MKWVSLYFVKQATFIMKALINGTNGSYKNMGYDLLIYQGLKTLIFFR